MVIWPQRQSQYYFTTTDNRFFDFSLITADQQTFSDVKSSGTYIGNNHPVPLYCIGPDGSSILAGTSKTYYQAASVACGSSCVTDVRTCSSTGTLSSSAYGYTITSCTVASCGGGSLATGLIHRWKFDESSWTQGQPTIVDQYASTYMSPSGSLIQVSGHAGYGANFPGYSSPPSYAVVSYG